MCLEEYVKSLVDDTVEVGVKVAVSGTIYIFLRRNGYLYRIRISDHKPRQERHTGWYYDIIRPWQPIKAHVKNAVAYFMEKTKSPEVQV